MRRVKQLLRSVYINPNDLIHPSLENLIMNEGVIFDNWIKNQRLDLRSFQSIGVPDACNVGNLKVWILKYLMREGKIYNETPIHYALLSQVSGILLMKGYQVQLPLEHFNGADIIAEKGNRKLAFEFEYHASVFTEKLLEKQKAYDEVIFIGTTKNIDRLRGVVENAVCRGSQLRNFLNSLP